MVNQWTKLNALKLILGVTAILGDYSVFQKTLQWKSKPRGYIARTLRAPAGFNGSEQHRLPPAPHLLSTSPSGAPVLVGATPWVPVSSPV